MISCAGIVPYLGTVLYKLMHFYKNTNKQAKNEKQKNEKQNRFEQHNHIT